MPVASVYENGGIIGQTLDLGSTEQYISGASTPSYVGSASTNNSTTLSLTGITDLQEGDLVLIWVTDDGGEQPQIASNGWTTVVINFNNSIRNLVAYKVMGSTVDTSIILSDDGTLDGDGTPVDAFTATAWRNVEWDTLGGFVTASGSTIDAGSVTVTTDNSVVVVLGAIDDDNSTISSPPTGYTVAVQDGRFGGSNAQMYKTGVSAGTEDPSSYTWASLDALLSRTVTLKPIVSYGNLKNSGIWNLNAVYALSITRSTINFVQYYENLSSDILTATQSLTNCSFGPSISGNKRVVVAVGTNQGGGAATFVGISSATINGTSATIIQNTSSTAGQEHASIIYADISGSVTSGTISITYNSTLTSSLGSQGTICGVYYIDNPENIVSVTSAFSHRNNSLGAHSATVSTSQGLVIASGAIGGSSSTSSLTWSGATEDYEYDPQPTRDDVYGGASIESSGSSVTVSTTPNTEYGVLAVASFNLST